MTHAPLLTTPPLHVVSVYFRIVSVIPRALMFNVEMETSSIVTEDMIVSLVEDYVSDQRQEEIPPMIGECKKY